MKQYYQSRNSEWKLEPVIYAKTVKQIQCYRFFQDIVRTVSAMSPAKIRKRDITNKLVAQRYIKAIEDGLLYIPKEYREAVFLHAVDQVEYKTLERRFYLTERSIKRYVQVYVWGVAEELGENFKT